MAYLPILRFEDGKVLKNNECINVLRWYSNLEAFAEDEDELMEYLKYIYLVADYASPYIEFTDIKDRCTQALGNVNLSKEQINSEQVLYALDEYDSIMRADTQMGFIDDLYTAINSTREYLRTVDYTKLVESGNRRGTPLYNPKDVITMAKDAEKVINSLESLKKKIVLNIRTKQEDDKKAQKSRGDRQRGFMSINLNS